MNMRHSNYEARNAEIPSPLLRPFSGGVTLLNEIVKAYPNAISFGPGQPPEDLFSLRKRLTAITTFVAHEARASKTREKSQWNTLGQYGGTKGLVNHRIARQLLNDEGIDVGADHIIVTTGAQEALAILLIGLFRPGRDVLLTSDPTYPGITALARTLGVEVIPIPSDHYGTNPGRIEQALMSLPREKKVVGIYDIPDFNNPLGTYLPLTRRLELLQVCKRHKILILEDNPYGFFRYEGEKLPTLMALDKSGLVIYIGSYSKSIFPALRVGFLALSDRCTKNRRLYVDDLADIKSVLSVNTCSLSQALLGGLLLQHRDSLRTVVRPMVLRLKQNRDRLLKALSVSLRRLEGRVTWNRPQGGFFLTMTVPFDFKEREMRECAEMFGTIVCPMSLFSVNGSCARGIRLSFSNLRPGQIEEGIARLVGFLERRIGSLS